jgi:hypothetical protein
MLHKFFIEGAFLVVELDVAGLKKNIGNAYKWQFFEKCDSSSSYELQPSA